MARSQLGGMRCCAMLLTLVMFSTGLAMARGGGRGGGGGNGGGGARGAAGASSANPNASSGRNTPGRNAPAASFAAPNSARGAVPLNAPANAYIPRGGAPYVPQLSAYRPAPPAPSYPATVARPTPTRPVAVGQPPEPTPAIARPQPVSSYRSAAAQHLYSLARTATWNMYENYSDTPTYAATYRAMHRLLQSAKGISTQFRSTAADRDSPLTAGLRARLEDAELQLTAIRAEVAAWPQESTNSVDSKPLGSQLERMQATLAGLLADVGLSTEAGAADDEDVTPIRSRGASVEAAAFAPEPLGQPEAN